MAEGTKNRPKGLRQVVYLPPKLHKMLRIAAARDKRSRSDLAAEAVAKYFQTDKEANGQG